MEPKEIDFEFPRGDTCPISFDLIDDNKNILKVTETDELYFTIKTDYNTSAFILQKKYSTGDIVEDGDKYKVILKSTDTASLDYNSYVYDVTLKSTDLVKTMVLGTITLTNEATHISNE